MANFFNIHKGYQCLTSEFQHFVSHLFLFFFFSFQTRKRNFGISYLSRDRCGAEMYLSLLSDWDLDVAFVNASKPYLQLKVDIKPSEDSKNISVSFM